MRIDLLKKLSSESGADIICLQETKADNSAFPLAELKSMGFLHILYRGQKSYNGVAILSKIPLGVSHQANWCDTDDSRHIAATLPNGMELHNFYIPAGGDTPDAATNPKFAYKLNYVREITSWWKTRCDPKQNLVMLGDLNIAPLENDVWSHKQLLKVVSHTPTEVELLRQLQESLNWIDTARHFVPKEQKLYSWWSYRNKDWRKSDRGRRLDHIWVTQPLAAKLKTYHSFIDYRDAPTPSDHIPIMVELNL